MNARQKSECLDTAVHPNQPQAIEVNRPTTMRRLAVDLRRDIVGIY